MKKLAFILFLILGTVAIYADDITDLMQRVVDTPQHVKVWEITSQNAISFEVRKYDPTTGEYTESDWTKVTLAEVDAAVIATENKLKELQAIRIFILEQLGLPPDDSELTDIETVIVRKYAPVEGIPDIEKER